MDRRGGPSYWCCPDPDGLMRIYHWRTPKQPPLSVFDSDKDHNWSLPWAPEEYCDEHEVTKWHVYVIHKGRQPDELIGYDYEYRVNGELVDSKREYLKPK